MKGWLKTVIRCIAFLVVCSMIFINTSDLVRRVDDESNEIHAFYDEPKNSIDVLYMGSSPILRGISPMLMWKEQGFTGYSRASALQPPNVSYGLLAESLEYQKPELVVLFPDNIFSEYDYAEREGDLRRSLDGMKISKYKLEAVRKITAEDNRQTTLSYLFPLFRYHERWKEINLAEDKPAPLLEHSIKKGHVYLKGGEPREYPQGFMEPTGAATPSFNPEAKAYFEKSVALCKEKGIPVLFLHLPKMSWSYEQSEVVKAFAKELGVDYLDCDVTEVREQLELDPKVDYYDQGHMNMEGSLKLSRWIGAYLKNAYALPDHRGDATYARWDEDYLLYAEKVGLKQE